MTVTAATVCSYFLKDGEGSILNGNVERCVIIFFSLQRFGPIVRSLRETNPLEEQ